MKRAFSWTLTFVISLSSLLSSNNAFGKTTNPDIRSERAG